MGEICERSERATENKKKRLGGNFKFSGCGFKKNVKNQFSWKRVHKKQFLANISKTERFSMYVAS